MIEVPRVVETEAVPIAKLYAKVPISETQTQMGLLLRELGEELQRQQVRPVGADGLYRPLSGTSCRLD